MNRRIIVLFSVLIFSACSSTKYTLPPNVFRSMITPKSLSMDYSSLKNLDRTFYRHKKLLIVAVGYDQFENVNVPSVSMSLTEAMQDITEKMKDSKLFVDVQFTTMSHFKIGSVEELSELSRHFGADYILLLNSAYNFYKYATTWGNFVAWFPILNFMVPFNRFTGTIFIEGTILSRNGAILHTESVTYQLSENTNILYSREHFLRMARELHQKSYDNLYTLLVRDLNSGGQR